MKFIIAIFVVLLFILDIRVYASSSDGDLAVYRLEEFCFRSLNKVNYDLLTQINLEGSDLGYMTEAKKEIFGDLLKSTYSFCSCVIDGYTKDVGIQAVIENISILDFWDKVVPKYSSVSEYEGGCYQEKSVFDFIPEWGLD